MGYKLATGFVEIRIGNEQVFMQATDAAVRRVMARAEAMMQSGFQRAMNKAADSATAFGLKATAALLPLEMAFKNAVKQGWDFAVLVGQTSMMFQQFGLSVQDADAFVGRLQKNAIAWGQDNRSTIMTARSLMTSFGGDVKQVEYAMSGLANMTGKYKLNTEQLNGVTRAFVQMQQKGKVQAEEMLQLAENGVNGWDLFAKATGKSVAELQKLTQTGKLFAKDTLPEVYKYLNENPEFAGKATANAKTLNGQMKNLGNNMREIFAGPFIANNDKLVHAFQAINKALENIRDSGVVDRFLQPMIDGFVKLATWFGNLSPVTQAFIAKLALAAVVMGPLALILGKVFRSLGSFGARVGEAAGRVSAFGSSIQPTASQLERWNGVMARVATGTYSLSNAFDRLLHPIQSVRDAASALSERFPFIGRAMDAVRHPITSLQEGFSALSTRLRLTYNAIGDGATRAFDRLRSAALQLDIRFRSLPATLGAVASSLGSGLASAATRAADVLRHPITSARLLGLSLREHAVSGLDALRGALGRGLDAGLRGLVRGMDLAGRGAITMGNGLKKLGGGALGMLKTGLLGASVGMFAFVASGQDVGPAIDGMVNQITSFLRNLPAVINTVAVKLPGMVTELVQSLTSAIPEIATAFTMAIPAIASALTVALPAIANIFGTVVPQIITRLLELLPGVVQTVLSVFPMLISSITSALPVVIKAFADMIPQIVRSLGMALPSLVQAFADGLVKIVDAVAQSLPVIIAAVVGIIPPLVNSLTAALPALVSAFAEAFPKIVEAIVNAIPGIVTAFADAIPKIVDALLRALPSVIQTFADAIPKIVTAVLVALPQIVAAFAKAIPLIVTAVTQNLPQIVRAFVDAIPQIVNSVVQNLPQIASAFAKSVPQIVKALADAGGQLFEAGANMVKKLIEGLGSMAGSLASKAKSLASSALDAINPFSSFSMPFSAEFDTSGLDSPPELAGLADFADFAAPVAVSYRSGGLAGAAEDLGGAITAGFSTGISSRDFRLPRARQEGSASSSYNVTVNARTDANAVDIGREVVWQMKTSGV
ncbi:tape measure protein [Kitasatospora sp. NPDC056184]|uniref:tape measure protein n=1 Tax=Kitasatospora sp. NPDC056184 TaxID=3345738 RepID=UPI0035E3571A